MTAFGQLALFAKKKRGGGKTLYYQGQGLDDKHVVDSSFF
jgi:hypothetical protein